jgi:hypothetical protein
MQVPPFVRRIFVKPTDEDRRPQFVAGEFTPIKHHLKEQEQQQASSRVFPNGRNKPWIKR